MLVDSHCHLDYLAREGDLDGVVGRARSAGIGRMLTICTKVSEFEAVLGIARRYPDIRLTRVTITKMKEANSFVGKDKTANVKVFVDGFAAFTIIDATVPPCGVGKMDDCKTPWDYCCEDRAVLTAHTAGVDWKSRDDMAVSAAQAIVDLSQGKWPAEKIVNPEVKAKFAWKS